MALDPLLLEILACPEDKGPLLYFADEEQANAADAVLAGLDEQARATLVARRVDGGYELDIHLQGPRETTFFAL